MKPASISANIRANKFKPNHKKRIINAFKGIMNGMQIAAITGLDYHAVMRRMSELEREGKIVYMWKKNNYSEYKLIS